MMSKMRLAVYVFGAIFMMICFIVVTRIAMPNYIKEREQELDQREKELEAEFDKLANNFYPDTTQILMIEGERWYHATFFGDRDMEDTTFREKRINHYKIQDPSKSCFFYIYEVTLGNKKKYYMEVSGYQPEKHPLYIEYTNDINKSNKSGELKGELWRLY